MLHAGMAGDIRHKTIRPSSALHGHALKRWQLESVNISHQLHHLGAGQLIWHNNLHGNKNMTGFCGAGFHACHRFAMLQGERQEHLRTWPGVMTLSSSRSS